MTDEVDPDRACDRCRERRVKCDKRKPECFRCEKAGQSCPGYAKKRKFVDEGAILRKRFEHQVKPATILKVPEQRLDDVHANRPLSKSSKSNTPSPRSKTHIRGWKNGLTALPHISPETTKSGVPVPVPVPSCGENTPFSTGVSSETDDPTGDLLDEYHAVFDPEWFDLDPIAYYSKSGNSCGFIPDIPAIVAEADPSTDAGTLESRTTSVASGDSLLDDDLALWAGESQLHTSQLLLDRREHEIAYLTRHFCENVGTWMDLFDAERHFAQLVPIKALRDVLLRYAIAAVAAKQLGCTMGNQQSTFTQCQQPATSELINAKQSADWYYSAANYYDKAIMHSRVYLQALSGSLNAPVTSKDSTSIGVETSDDLLLAVSIFSMYEWLDNAISGWDKHLHGLKTILSVLNSPSSRSPVSDHNRSTLGRRASFWNFARADYQSAYINRTTTFLDPHEYSIWLEAGLQIKSDGGLYSEPEGLAKDNGELSQTNELVAQTLFWIVLQTMNFLFRTQSDTLSRRKVWEQLDTLLNSWQAARPRSFQPCIRLRHQLSRNRAINEIFFSNPLCAATTQLYHFARLLLLLNRPSQVGVGGTLDMTELEKAEMLLHAHTILGIALARPCQAVRVEMLLPLHLVGTCLSDEVERRTVVDLLDAIQKDTGCHAGRSIREITTTQT